MNTKRTLPALGLIALALASLSSCKRDSVNPPSSPIGPSTIGTILGVDLNPNVIYAGVSRDTVVITATLKKYSGTPISDRTIYFETRDVDGNKINIGYFEDQPLVASKNTDGTGTVKVVYHGPLAEEITSAGEIRVYVWTHLEENDDIVFDSVPLQILQEPIKTWALVLAANPNVLVAGTERERSMITAVLTNYDGSPIPNKSITFKVADDTGAPVNLGYFEGNKNYITKTTDEQGMITLRYYSPLAEELTASQTVYIWGTANYHGQDFVDGYTPIQLLQEPVTAWTLTVQAVPNVLIAGTVREDSTITATLTKPNGAPIPNKSVTLKVADDTGAQQTVGYFDGGQTYFTKTTDAQGRIRIKYYGPLASEITGSMTIYIWGTVGYEGQEFIEGNAPIQVLQDTRPLSFDAAAYPSVLFASKTRPKSKITATVKLGSMPVKGRRVFYSILNNAPGKFANGNRSAIATTDENGETTITYLGPLSSEFTWEIGVYIRVQLETLGNEAMTYEDVYIRVKQQE